MNNQAKEDEDDSSSSNNKVWKGRRRNGTSGWGLSLKYWMAQKQLAALVGSSHTRIPPKYGATQCFNLLKRYPKLSTKRYERPVKKPTRTTARAATGGMAAIFPLQYVLEMCADLEIVQEIHEMYPDAVREPVYDNHNHENDLMPVHQQQEPTKPAESVDFPLHRACQLGKVSPQVIQFLARCSGHEIVGCVDSLHHLPLHSILRNSHRSATLAEIETLLDIYPNAILENCGGGGGGAGTPIVLALKSSHTTREVLELLVQRFTASLCLQGEGDNNRNKKEFRLPSRENVVIKDHVHAIRYILQYDRFHSITLWQAECLSIMIPHLQFFSCIPKRWHRDAFLHLMKHFQQTKSLIELTLYMPPSLLLNNNKKKKKNNNNNTTATSSSDDDDDEVCYSIQHLLERNQSLECLHIDFGYEQRLDGAASMYTNEAIRKCLRGLAAGLCANHNSQEGGGGGSLRECYLSGRVLTQSNDVLVFLKKQQVLQKEFWIPLRDHLCNQSNFALERVAVETTSLRGQPHHHSHSQRQQLSLEFPPECILKVQYWTTLNRYGRGQVARNPNLTLWDLIGLILRVNNEEEEEREKTKAKTKKIELMMFDSVSILYGLLQERPALWSTSSSGSNGSAPAAFGCC